MVLADKFEAAQAALTIDLQRDPNDTLTKYWLAFVRRANGDTTGVTRLLTEAGAKPRTGPAPMVALARARAALRDTAGARGDRAAGGRGVRARPAGPLGPGGYDVEPSI